MSGTREIVFSLRAARLDEPAGVSLSIGDLEIRDRVVTVILGPAGTGKSTFLRALVARAPTEVARLGEWRGPGAGVDVHLVPQPTYRGAPTQRLKGNPIVDSEVGVLLLDEPDRGVPESDIGPLALAVRKRAERGAVVVATHHVGFARAVGDDFAFFCAGRVHAKGSIDDLFDHPASPLVEQFVRHGNAWPAAAPPPLPTHFSWVIPDKLAGMGRPGLVGAQDDDLLAIASAGISLLVSLTEEPFPEAQLRSVGIASKHFPIRDMGVPSLGATAGLCRDIVRAIDDGARVAVHCHAGLGRTGTILAALLAWMGRTPEDAVSMLRRISPHYLQTKAQVDFVRHFAETWLSVPPLEG